MKLHVSTDNTEYPIITNNKHSVEDQEYKWGDEKHREEIEINEQDHENND